MDHGLRMYRTGCRCDICKAEKSEYTASQLAKRVANTPFDQIPHGEVRGYTSYSCRCEDCRRASRDHRRQQRDLAQPPKKHGTVTAYVNNKCRCELCSFAYREKKRRADLQARYGITVEDFQGLFDSQGGRCAICRWDFSMGKKNPSVDHDHNTGRVRGLLCTRCNSGLGYVKDSPETLELLISYLAKTDRIE